MVEGIKTDLTLGKVATRRALNLKYWAQGSGIGPMEGCTVEQSIILGAADSAIATLSLIGKNLAEVRVWDETANTLGGTLFKADLLDEGPNATVYPGLFLDSSRSLRIVNEQLDEKYYRFDSSTLDVLSVRFPEQIFQDSPAAGKRIEYDPFTDSLIGPTRFTNDSDKTGIGKLSPQGVFSWLYTGLESYGVTFEIRSFCILPNGYVCFGYDGPDLPTTRNVACFDPASGTVLWTRCLSDINAAYSSEVKSLRLLPNGTLFVSLCTGTSTLATFRLNALTGAVIEHAAHASISGLGANFSEQCLVTAAGLIYFTQEANASAVWSFDQDDVTVVEASAALTLAGFEFDYLSLGLTDNFLYAFALTSNTNPPARVRFKHDLSVMEDLSTLIPVSGTLRGWSCNGDPNGYYLTRVFPLAKAALGL